MSDRLKNNKVTEWEGILELEYRHREGETLISHQRTQAPLKLQCPFYPEGKAICHSVILHTAGGIVGGDRLSQTLHLHPHSQVFITTPAATKIYRSNGKTAHQTVTLSVEANAILEWFPQETIVFNGAQYHPKIRVELGENALWLGWDITRFGRSARGEEFLQGEWRSQTEIWRKGVPLWVDRQYLRGNPEILHSYNGLNGYPLVGTLVWMGKPVPPDIIAQARNAGHELSGETGVTQLQEQGLICRYRGNSTAEVRQWFTMVWHLLRQSGLGRLPIKPRIWSV